MSTFEERHPGLKGKQLRGSAFADCVQDCEEDVYQNGKEAYYIGEDSGWYSENHGLYVQEDIDATQIDKEVVRAALGTYWERTTTGDHFEWSHSDAMDELKRELGL